MKSGSEKAFEKGVPSAFVVGSPLQLLCAVEAEKEFEVAESRYVIILRPNWPRNEQVLSMVAAFGIKNTDIIYTDDISLHDAQNHIGYFSEEVERKYDRVFIGDYTDYYDNVAACKYVREGTYLLYLDDGCASISLFQGKTYVPKPQQLRQRLHWWRQTRHKYSNARRMYSALMEQYGAIDTSCFFTLFSNVKSKKYQLYPNRFNHLKAMINTSAEEKTCVVILGTIFDKLAELNGVTEEHIEAVYWEKMSKIKMNYLEHEILFIPHGRDINQHIPYFCEMLGIEYKKISEPVEWFILRFNIRPIAIFGQGSTALYTLKMLFPEAKVVNWFLYKKYGNPGFEHEFRIAKEYRKEGIIEERIIFPSLSCQQKWALLKADAASIKEWLIDRCIK